MSETAIGTGYRRRIAVALHDLGIDPWLLATRKLPMFPEARRLAPAGLGSDGRDKMLAPAAATAWRKMKLHARAEGVTLLLISGFRSVEYQTELIRGKLQRGMPIEEILKVNAPPGYSEHHTGEAVDIGVADCPPLDERFETTTAFAWLQQHAREFGLSMSYPRGNAEGYLYEPWHWRFKS